MDLIASSRRNESGALCAEHDAKLGGQEPKYATLSLEVV